MRRGRHTMRGPRTQHGRAGGFTLVELLVVMGIILLLVAIGVGVGTGLIASSKGNQTKARLRTLRSIATEYRVKTGTPVNHTDVDSGPFPWSNGSHPTNTDAEGIEQGDRTDGLVIKSGSSGSDAAAEMVLRSIERFVWATYDTSQKDGLTKVYANLPGDALTDEEATIDGHTFDSGGNGFLEIRDAWGTPIAYARGVDHDGENDDQRDDFLPEHSKPFFVSAGPDERFGSVNVDQVGEDSQAFKASRDNIVSFEMEQ